MRTDGLNFDNIPPLSIPYGFFATAPLFGVLAGLVLLFQPQALTARWEPAALALVHLLTLGFAAQIMLGALCQVMPVVSSQPIPLSRPQALLVRGCISIGTLLLSLTFLFPGPILFSLTLSAFIFGFGLFIFRLLQALIKIRPAGHTLVAIRLAAFCLLITLLAGVILLWWRSSPQTAPLAPILTTDQHALWGIQGWGLLLVVGVSFQVIPMFHVAPDFPARVQRWLPAALLLSLLLGTALDGIAAVLMMALSKLLVLGYCALAAHHLARRRRKLLDYTIRFWQLALGCIALSMLVNLATLGWPELPNRLPLAELSAILFGFGGLLAVIFGMLQKIVPFLLYLHLQRQCLTQPEKLLTLPNMKQLISTDRSKRQWWLHCTALCGLLIALWLPILTPLAALLLIADFVWLGWTLHQAFALYRQHLN
ncbi:hypothetical protein [Motiliproteus sp.]|uniref:hypothetical protein n=1 Tax=Motiliproteus sp. TaxID=1898955 RepID=UPI003BA8E94A